MSARWFWLVAGVVSGMWLPEACSVYDPSLVGTGHAATGASSAGGAEPDGGITGTGTGGTGNTGNAGGQTTTTGSAADGGTEAATTGGPGAGGLPDGGSEGGAAAISGAGGERPDGSTTVDPAQIEDMEDGNGTILRREGRQGTWFMDNDGTGMLESPMSQASPTSEILGGRGDSTRAIHFSGSGFTGYGAQIGFSFVENAMGKQVYDISMYKGIRFYGAVGEDPGEGSGDAVLVQVNISTIQTDPHTDASNPEPLCDVEAEECFDHFGWDVMLEGSWQEYALRFNAMDFAQRGFGLPALWDPEHALQVIFKVEGAPDPGVSFDFWIDDISFIE